MSFGETETTRNIGKPFLNKTVAFGIMYKKNTSPNIFFFIECLLKIH